MAKKLAVNELRPMTFTADDYTMKFEKEFGNEVEITEDFTVATSHKINWEWVAENVLHEKEYNKFMKLQDELYSKSIAEAFARLYNEQ